jgi:hypothetical protein
VKEIKLPSKTKKIKHTKTKEFGSALLNSLDRTPRPSILSVNLIREPLYRSGLMGFVAAGCTLLATPTKALGAQSN